mmetsp:Transcript_22622/g.42623  ORF Transcript_22622/g.42623 Transcript_22622/m.42623 type:complete len:136 (-) Transcript_22622:124-531(-)
MGSAAISCPPDECRIGGPQLSPQQDETLLMDLSGVKVSAFDEEETDSEVLRQLLRPTSAQYQEPAIWCEVEDQPASFMATPFEAKGMGTATPGPSKTGSIVSRKLKRQRLREDRQKAIRGVTLKVHQFLGLLACR